MGYKPRIDYDTVVKPLFMAGMELPDISRNNPEIKYHALRKYAEGHGWRKEREDAKKAVVVINSQKLASTSKTPPICMSGARVAANVLVGRKQMYLEKVSAVIDRAADVLSKQDLADLEDVKRAFKAFEPVNEVAKSVHGLSKGDNAPQFEINFISKMDFGDIPEADAEVVQSQ